MLPQPGLHNCDASSVGGREPAIRSRETGFRLAWRTSNRGGWRAYLAHDPEEEDFTYAVVYCPDAPTQVRPTAARPRLTARASAHSPPIPPTPPGRQTANRSSTAKPSRPDASLPGSRRWNGDHTTHRRTGCRRISGVASRAFGREAVVQQPLRRSIESRPSRSAVLVEQSRQLAPTASLTRRKPRTPPVCLPRGLSCEMQFRIRPVSVTAMP